MSYALTLVEELQSTKSVARIADAMLQVGKYWAEKLLSDDEYQMLSAFLHLKRKAIRGDDTVQARMPHIAETSRRAGFVSFFPKRRPQPKSPDYGASQERRKMIASLGGLPATIQRKFTTAQQAVLKIIADEVKRKGFCALYLGEIAARAGCSMTWARTTLREASFMGLLTIQERKQDKRPNKSNVIRIISAEWHEWIASKRFFLLDVFSTAFKPTNSEGGACTKVESTDKVFTKPSGRDASHPYTGFSEPPN